MRKALFCTPVSKSSDAMEATVKKLQVEVEVDKSLPIVGKELHEQQLCKMKQLLEDSKKDDWMYRKVDDLIGF